VHVYCHIVAMKKKRVNQISRERADAQRLLECGFCQYLAQFTVELTTGRTESTLVVHILGMEEKYVHCGQCIIITQKYQHHQFMYLPFL